MMTDGSDKEDMTDMIVGRACPGHVSTSTNTSSCYQPYITLVSHVDCAPPQTVCFLSLARETVDAMILDLIAVVEPHELEE